MEAGDWEPAARHGLIRDGQDGNGTTLYRPKLSWDHTGEVTSTSFVSCYVWSDLKVSGPSLPLIPAAHTATSLEPHPLTYLADPAESSLQIINKQMHKKSLPLDEIGEAVSPWGYNRIE